VLLPQIAGLEAYREFRKRRDQLPAAAEICRRHSLEPAGLSMAGSGTHLVFLLPGLALKVFSPIWPEDFTAEREALRAIGGGAFPQILFEGCLDGWPYLVMTRIRGVPAADVWPDLPLGDRCRLLEELGGIIRVVHSNRPPPRLATGWDGFLSERRAGLDAGNMLPPGPWLDWLHSRTARCTGAPFEPVLLHADITPDHVFLAGRPGGWRVSGLIDFGDAMGGHPLYELGAPLLFFCFGEPRLTESLLAGAGAGSDPATAADILACSLLHRFGRLRMWLDRVPVADGGSFEEALFGFRLD
jgi:hygromycin-B 7''-O-kinase